MTRFQAFENRLAEMKAAVAAAESAKASHAVELQELRMFKSSAQAVQDELRQRVQILTDRLAEESARANALSITVQVRGCGARSAA